MSTIVPTYINVNVNGIPALRSLSVNVSATQVAIDFRNHRSIGGPFRGLLVLNIAQSIPEGTTTTLPVVLTSDGNNPQPLTTFNGEAVTVANIPGAGIYLAWYEAQTNTLQLLTGVIA